MIYLFNELSRINEENIENLLELLPPGRKERALKHRFLSGKVACVMAYLLFLYGYREIYGKTDTPEFELEENGKPYIASHPDIYFNISHCSGAVACVFADSPVGIDIQECRKVTPSHIRKICTEAETESIIASQNPMDEFCKIWTIKEAVSKCSGEGIFKSLHNSSTQTYCTFTKHIEPDMYMTVASKNDIELNIEHISFDKIINGLEIS